MTGVQLIGKKAVLSRYISFGAESWALYQGKQFICGGEGAQSLEEWLTDFEQCGSTATYSIRVYDTDGVPTSSTAGSDYIACIAFKLVDMYEGHGIAGHTTKLMERIAGLEKKLEEREEPEESDLNTIIMDWLSNPEKLGQVAGAIRVVMGGSAAALPAPAAQAISGVKSPEPAADPDALTRLAAAIDILEKRDPRLVEHLEKLAKMAESDPMMFKAIISKIDLL